MYNQFFKVLNMEKKRKDISSEELKQIGKRVKYARMLTNLTALEFSSKYQLNFHTLSSLESGRYYPSEKILSELVKAFHTAGVSCTTQWFLEGKGLSSDLMKNSFVPVLSEHSSKTNIEEDFSIWEEIEYFKKKSNQVIISLIQDDAMLPWYNLGDFVGGRLVDDKNLLNCLGKFCLVEIEPEFFVVRYLIQQEENFILSGINLQSKTCTPLLIKPSMTRIANIFWHRIPE